MTENPTLNDAEIGRQLAVFIAEELLYDRDDVLIDAGTQLLESGYVDSMGIFRLIDYIEQAFGVTIRAEEVLVEHFRTIETMTALIHSQHNSGQG